MSAYKRYQTHSLCVDGVGFLKSKTAYHKYANELKSKRIVGARRMHWLELE